MKIGHDKFWGMLLILIFCACNQGRPCINLKLASEMLTLSLIDEPYGPTDINAISGNQGLSVAFNEQGTITVFKWPNPSFYDQVKYMTTDRDKDRLGALPDEGVFAGIYFETDAEKGFFWLRDLEHYQKYLGPRSVAVEMIFSAKPAGLEISQTDFVESGEDVLWRHYQVKKIPGSRVRLVAYADFAPKVSKWTRLPMADWCFDPMGDSTLKWDKAKKIFLQSKQGKDQSTRKPGSVWIGFGFDQPVLNHHAGHDRSCSIKKDSSDSFVMAQQGTFPDSDFAAGKPSAAVSTELNFSASDQAQADFLVAVSDAETQTASLIGRARRNGFSKALSETEDHWQTLLKSVPLPATDNERIKEVAIRSVITILLDYCPQTGAFVDSIATQPPYSEDWQRDGSYMNEALMAAGFNDLVKQHNLFYVKVQSQPGHKLAQVPEGNWASNYYADGVPGMPLIPWELDETGFAVWSLYRYFEMTGDKEYLDQAYPAIKRAADFMTRFKDPATGLPRPAYESDELTKYQSIRGALSVYMGLRYAAQAGPGHGR
jgi:hypothetical protein